ncbi:class I SAM-dependent methyltransferase [Streptomyces sp. MST-110588]|uniref:class I SAM-dependent methyltransferase n=1 Tax=Streptomyces sp. MST-110588 TaxID=2833628 RepID=UPI001F5D5B48|nr:class I SAM-dependent methyltransferase [Streptomyces sp. MST-110588]UNO42920.1 class I SAM-dependent methyltransferase [Streptomyces sp. MST-110588]
MPEPSPARFFGRLAESYHLLYADWAAAVIRQGRALDAYIRAAPSAPGEEPRAPRDPHGLPRPRRLLDCACGIGTQAVGLAAAGHDVTGTDLSPVAAARAAREAAGRGLRLRTAAADMRRLPFRDGEFDAVVCADNSLAHLLTPQDVRAALRSMERVLRPGGLLLIGMRAYEQARAERPESTPLRVARTPDGGRVVTFQLWEWHEDGEHYDFDLVQLLPHGDTWEVRSGRTTSWALSRDQVTGFVREVGLEVTGWHEPADSGFFQPLLTARKRPAPTG